MENRKQIEVAGAGETKSSREVAVAVEKKAAEVAGAGETESRRGGCSMGNRKQQRWLEQGKQKAAEKWL